MNRLAIHLLLLLAAGALLGCDRQERAQADATSGPAAPPKPVSLGSGTISGKVTMAGLLPPSAPIAADFCADPAHAPQMARAEQIVVNPNHTLRNVVVYLKAVSAPLPPGAKPALLDQVRCRYAPHVLALQTGQTLTVRSSDDMPHNVHLITESNPPANIGMTRAGQTKDFSFKTPDRIAVKCDVHPWMLAHILVFDHPFYAVTGEDGSFTIPRVPAGTYQVAAWHERLEEQEQTITVTENQTAALDFAFNTGN